MQAALAAVIVGVRPSPGCWGVFGGRHAQCSRKQDSGVLLPCWHCPTPAIRPRSPAIWALERTYLESWDGRRPRCSALPGLREQVDYQGGFRSYVGDLQTSVDRQLEAPPSASRREKLRTPSRGWVASTNECGDKTALVDTRSGRLFGLFNLYRAGKLARRFILVGRV